MLRLGGGHAFGVCRWLGGRAGGGSWRQGVDCRKLGCSWTAQGRGCKCGAWALGPHCVGLFWVGVESWGETLYLYS